MTAIDIIRLVYAHGGTLTLEGGLVKVHAPAPLPDDLRQAIREHKSTIMIALGAPIDTVIHDILGEVRAQLPASLKNLSDEKLLTMVNWSIMAAWQKSLQSLEDDHQERTSHRQGGRANAV